MLSARRFGARLRHAVISASRTAPFLAARNRTFVAPPRPQPPLTGAKAAGWARTNSSCCRGELHHAPTAARIAEGRENPAGHPEVGVAHVPGLAGLRETQRDARSEERRVGKECGFLWAVCE